MRCARYVIISAILSVAAISAIAITDAPEVPEVSTDISGPWRPMHADSLMFGSNFFPILPWSPLHGWKPPRLNRALGLESIAECKFTLGGFVQPDDLPECGLLNMGAILAPPDDGVFSTKFWREMSDEQIDATVRTMVGRGGHRKAILGYFLMDEPGTSSFPALGKAVAAVKKYAPGKLAYINLFPGYATLGAPDASQLEAASFAEYLERFVSEVKPQILSYDNYMVQYSDDLQNKEAAAQYYSDLLEVRRVALKNDLPFWNIVASNQLRPKVTIPSPANLAFQAYTTLAAGGTGVSWYTYYATSNASSGRGYAYAPVDEDGAKTETWDYLRLINTQLNVLGPIMTGLKSTGVFFTGPAPCKDAGLLPGRIVESVAARASVRDAAQSAPPMMIGEFTGNDAADYVMVVNLSLERSANVMLHLQKAYKTSQVISAADSRRLPLDTEKGHWIVAGGGLLFRFE